jgi:hypothetical protein
MIEGYNMTNYLFNARDIAAYFKWSGVPGFLEKNYLEFLFEHKKQLLARPMTADYETFEREVFREMYFLWSLGFINEFSDVSLIAPDGSITLFCDQRFIGLESYMKLISLHLILSANLPYVRINFVGLPLLLGISGDYDEFEKNVYLSFEALRLHASDIFGKDFDISIGIPNELLCVSLRKDLKDAIFGENGSGRRAVLDDSVQMSILRDKSMKEEKVREMLRQAEEEKQSKRAVRLSNSIKIVPKNNEK